MAARNLDNFVFEEVCSLVRRIVPRGVLRAVLAGVGAQRLLLRLVSFP